MIKLVDQLSAMGSFPIATAQDIVCSDNERLQEKIDNGTLGGGSGTSYVELSEEEYFALSDEQRTSEVEYRTYDTGRIFKRGVEYGKDGVQISDVVSEDSTWSSKKINDSLVDKQDFRIFKSLEEFNEKKGTSFTVVSGVDNMVDIANAMSEGDMLIITTKYTTGSEIYFGLDSSTGWTKMFTLTRIGGLCDIKCTTSAVKNLTRVLAGSTLTDWQELATIANLGEKLYIDNSYNASVKYVKIASAPANGNSIDIHFKSARTNTTFEEETVRVSAYVSKTIYDGKIIQKGLYAANGNKPNENEANFLVILDDYSVWAHIASYSTAEIELYSYGRKQSIDGTEATTLPSEVKYSMFNGTELATMDKVADVPNTVIVSKDTKVKLNSNCYYTVINGVCYVTLWGFTCTEAGQYVVNSSMPKTRLTMNGLCTHGSNGYEGGCAYIYYDGNGNNKLYVEAKTANEPLYGSFSYPVAEL